MERLVELSEKIGKDNLVVDISCRKSASGWVVAMNKWQDNTDLWVNKGNISLEHLFFYVLNERARGGR
ncbi:1-(5-phosphoribosyl)-5-[(5-phosphoribosylamino)methylideneamino] imidazole-4-carboxamide isomerase [Zancudomyces culisetae]|uniref:1-(5-phosphoribosyl)-5-[(5-phosphoribosylamino)methylideneamino] imidazole-4-carboxamide isomerase n=1 Tax=Zancudomyces culisetae TaxID=1213189 RepID=A0A1R1PF13_ZANCU|nr:1-(5-phosphoribosyl)-5-[(5-phosphoribosylamino)methylideneamino] imidazole-4-carboxamide isomerase [Zancudomyces culisetae]|eukprot:OMH79590.1 1-(5-phosphoribosyl)-5-[(5-phosphoribosylamino)methylideneamino] imidazole-4-carboxamide isomerase [Zancudomyces culisetae]